jgi:thiamine biosynthesis lipoprotein
MRRVLIPREIAATPPALGGMVRSLEGRTMGTTWSVKLVLHPQDSLQPWQQAIEQQLDTVVAQMSTWEAGSDLSRFNRAPPGHWQSLPCEFFEVLSCAVSVAQASQGAYDPTAGALVNLWGFGPSPRHDEPGFRPLAGPVLAKAVAAATAATGWHRLVLDPATQSARQAGGVTLDLSAIAKGYAVDQVVRALLQRGCEHHLVEIGGELRGTGIKPDGQPWWVGLERPPSPQDNGGTETLVALHGLSVATSGDYRRYFIAEGQRHAHTIDPRTGWPVRHALASVTVLHPECMLADAWSTALTVLGPDEGLRCARELGLIALFVLRHADGFEERMSDAFAALAA